MVKNVIHTWARRVGCSAIKEPQNLVAGQERADNLIYTPSGELFLCDVSVVQPSCPTHVNRAQKRLGAADFAAKEKHNQYDQMAREEEATFVPLIAETFGALHGDLLSFVKRLARIAHLDESCGWSRLEVIAGMKGAISVAIQKGNAKTLDRVQLSNRKLGRVLSQAQRDAVARRDAQRGVQAQPQPQDRVPLSAQ